MKRWLAQWSINEDEPTWPQVAVAGVLFLLMLVVFPALVVLVAAGMDVL